MNLNYGDAIKIGSCLLFERLLCIEGMKNNKLAALLLLISIRTSKDGSKTFSSATIYWHSVRLWMYLMGIACPDILFVVINFACFIRAFMHES